MCCGKGVVRVSRGGRPGPPSQPCDFLFMATKTQASTPVAEPAEAWDEELVKKAYSHMRIHFRQVSPAVRNMVLQECMSDVDPERGVEGLVDCIEAKLKLG